MKKHEMWLEKNKVAKKMVMRGLQDAKKGNFSKPPASFSEDEKLIKQLKD